MQQSVIINLPTEAMERINQIVEKQKIFEDHVDFILHAITDLLEEYK